MCTAQLIPETMSAEKVKNSRFEDDRPESELVANTPERMREKGDMAQYERYKKVMGKSAPSFDKFKEIKYNGDSEGYEELKARYRTFKNTVSYADLPDEIKKVVDINPDLNNRHIVGTQQWKDKVINYKKQSIEKGYSGKYEPSYLNIDNEQSQKIVEVERYPKRFAGKYIVHAGNKNIAIFIDPETGAELPTKYVKISFRKTGSHLTPIDPRTK
jgi:hypothetical protein